MRTNELFPRQIREAFAVSASMLALMGATPDSAEAHPENFDSNGCPVGQAFNGRLCYPAFTPRENILDVGCPPFKVQSDNICVDPYSDPNHHESSVNVLPYQYIDPNAGEEICDTVFAPISCGVGLGFGPRYSRVMNEILGLHDIGHEESPAAQR